MTLLGEFPSIFYVFVNFTNPITRHNISVTKTFRSAAYSEASGDSTFREKYQSGAVDYLPFVWNEQQPDFKSPFCMNVINNYRVEMDAELARRQYYPLLPSRLSAIHVFGDYEMCEAVSKKYGWRLEEVRRFRLQPDDLTRVTKVNMEIISLARRAYAVSSLDAPTIDQIWRHYWSEAGELKLELPSAGKGRKIYDSGIIWEYLVEGRLTLDEESRP